MTYKIIYIDEQEEDGDSFKDFVEKKDSMEEFIVEYLPPAQSINEMLEQIKEHSPDALVSDYKLNEHIHALGYNVPYNGTELVTNFLQIRKNFPCFVITSFASDAANSSDDVNIVYVKKVLNETETSDLNFLERIKIQIDHYRTKIDKAENELQELLNIKNNNVELTADQEQKIIDLDSILESSIDGRQTLPSDLKSLSNTKKLSELITSVDKLLMEICNGK